MPVFQGHGSLQLAINLAWAIAILFFVWRFSRFFPHLGRQMKFSDWIRLWVLVMILPNSMYAFFEIKHLLFAVPAVGLPNFYSYLVFGGISLVGLISTLATNSILIRHYARSTDEVLFYAVVLSLINGFGAVAGLMDYYSISGLLFPPLILLIGWQIVNTPLFLSLAVMATILIFTLTTALLLDSPRNRFSPRS